MAKKRMTMVMDVRRCIGCQACTVSCKTENDVPLGVWRTQIRAKEVGKYPYVRRHFYQWICAQCGNCVEASANNGVGAVSRRDDGIVVVDYEKLTKGRTKKQIDKEIDAAVEACPIGAFSKNPATGLPEKCNQCAHRVDKGLVPACVQTCIGRARIYGDANDPMSEVSKLLGTNANRPAPPNDCDDPHVFYIALDGSLVDRGALEGFQQIKTEDFNSGKIDQIVNSLGGK
ncbi:MAG: 4Fe-4S dicluster domain-containing protein [Deltaproteobacteria bacterium]|nr:4Fe-4S dicluster domain-containing protein [Deltaproteobacteria bacterium]